MTAGSDDRDGDVAAMLARFTRAFNDHDLAGVMGCFAEDCSFWSAAGPDPRGGVHEGRAAVAAATAAIFDAFPDARWSGEPPTLLGDKAVWEWIFTGTAGDGTAVRVLGADILDLRGAFVLRKNSFRKTVTAPPPGR